MWVWHLGYLFFLQNLRVPIKDFKPLSVVPIFVRENMDIRDISFSLKVLQNLFCAALKSHIISIDKLGSV